MATRMSADQRREQLLDVTKDLVSREGFHAVSIEAIAREAGITRPIVYGHFRDLPSLLEALVDREGVRALDQLSEVLSTYESDGEPADLMLAALRGYLEAVRADPATWRLVLMPPEGAPAVLRERISAGRFQVVGQLAQVVGTGFGEGTASPDPELTARMLSAVSDEAARLLLTDPERYPPERLLSHAAWAMQLLPRSAGTSAGRTAPQ